MMKSKFYLIRSSVLCTLLLLLSYQVFAQAPTTSSSDLSVTNLDGDRLILNFTRGDGEKRIIIARANNPVTAVPQDGTDYLDDAFGDGNEIAPGQFVVYEGTASSIWITGLSPSTTYHFRVYEFNGINFNTQYLTSSFLSGSASTVSAPTTQASNISFSNITGTSMTVSWLNGNGNGRILIAKEGSPVDVEPEDVVNYSASGGSFGVSWSQIGSTGNYALYQSSGSSTNVTNLDPNKTYHFALFEYNGSSGKVFLRPGTRASQITASKPTVAATNFNTDFIDGNGFRYSFTRGDGERRIVIAREGSPVTATPVDGEEYTANSDFGNGDQITTEEFVVYNGAGDFRIFLTNLNPSTTYYLKVFEYNGEGENTFFLTDEFLTGSVTTLSGPSTQASDISFSNITGTSMTVSWTNGDGNGRILLAKEGSPVDAEPQNLINYSSSSFGFGSQIGTGNFVVYQSSGSSTNVTNLDANKTYHFALFEYNGSSGKLFLRPGTTASASTSSKPTIAATNFNAVFIDGNGFRYSFTRGDGERRIVI
ncbi:MAG: fibronectin type III domain-containing protein, partial [Cyclobacteriaceae bacterium]